ncbi:MAG TPA: DNA-3-methyladenine glycosylase [Mycobacteriales bacterium]|nr:DNA-3-methyladenine glycosylase [Mycobacteriales bacterium]
MPAAEQAVARDALARDVLDVAPDLLGCLLVAGGVSVRLTEVEAYAGQSDPGSHAYRGRTPRTAVMFGPPGHAYVYFTYGMHWCMNVVTGPDGTASAVLLRAGEVVGGLEVARERRPGVRDRDLCRGPARLTRTLGVDREHDGVDLLDPAAPVRLLPGPPTGPDRVRTGPRVGVAGAGAPTPWRFWVDGEPTVSPYRAAVPRRRQ